MNARMLVIASLALAFASSARAGFIVSVNDTSIAAGSTGSIDVSIKSEDGTPITLDNFSLEVLVTAQSIGNPAAQLSIGPITDALYSNSSYVFYGNSLYESWNVLPGTTGNTNWSNDTYFGGDATLTGLGEPVGSTSMLLAQLDLTTVLGGNSPSAGDVFTVSIQDTGFTAFADSDFNPIGFRSESGHVHIVDTPNPVPAPVGLIVALTAFGTLGLRRMLSKRYISCACPIQ